MNLSILSNKLTLAVGKASLQMSKQSPHILFGAGIVGFGATIYFSSKAALGLEENLTRIKSNLDDVHTMKQLTDEAAAAGKVVSPEDPGYYDEMQYRKDLGYCYLDAALRFGKLYGPAIVSGVLSIAFLTKSHVILTNRNTALMAAYSVLEKSYNRYRSRVVAELGEEKDREFHSPVEKAIASSFDEEGNELTDSEKTKLRIDKLSSYARFFDEGCSPFKKQAELNYIFLKAQQNYANDMLRSRGHLFLNEVYDMIGIPRSKAGSVVGWVIGKDGDNFVDFGLFDITNPAARDFVNGREGVILLDFNVDGVIYDKIDYKLPEYFYVR